MNHNESGGHLLALQAVILLSALSAPLHSETKIALFTSPIRRRRPQETTSRSLMSLLHSNSYPVSLPYTPIRRLHPEYILARVYGHLAHSEAETAGNDLAVSSMQRGTDARPIDANRPTSLAISAAEHLQARAPPL